MIYITALATLLLLSGSSSVTTAKNYGPTTEQCDAKTGIGCDAKDAPTNDNATRRKRQELTPEKFHTTNKKKKSSDSNNDDDDDDATLLPGECGLYLAPSSLPHAGLGLFAGSTIPFDSSVNEYIGGTFPGYNDEEDTPLWTDLFIPIADKYKALPYRGQQRFPSWLQYVWPESSGAMSDFTTKAFPVVPPQLWDFDQGLNSAIGLEFYMDDLNDMLFDLIPDYQPEQRVNAFAPGIASLANHAGVLSNVDRIYAKSRADYNGQEAPWHAGAGAFTPHHGVEFIVTEEEGIKEGSELLIDYGEEWHFKNDMKLNWIAERTELIGKHPKRGFVDGGINKKWDWMDERERDDVPSELPTEKAKRDRISLGMAADSSEIVGKPYSEYRENNYLTWNEEEEQKRQKEEQKRMKKREERVIDEETAPARPLPWLSENGVCLSSGKLKVNSSPIQFAGRGVLATTHIGKGEVVITSPLLAMRREDFTIYKTNPDASFVREIIDKTKEVGIELLYNYAFSHKDSPLYLVPTAPMANFINHGGPFTGSLKPRSEGANVQIRWPKEGSNSAKLFEWAYNQKHGDHFDNDFEKQSMFNTNPNPNPWLKDHPIDVMERSGKLALEYVALRDIHNGEEILLDYGQLWEDMWNDFDNLGPYARPGYFRHNIGVPNGFFPESWMHVGDRYEIAEIKDLKNKPLEPGVALPMTWAHNGKPLGSKYAYVVGLEKGFSDKFLEYSEKMGVIELYRKLLTEQEGYHLPSDGFSVYNPAMLPNVTSSKEDKRAEFFAHRYKTIAWNFNMHFVAAWNEKARKSLLKALGDSGFDLAIKGLGDRFGYDNMTCFHASYMGMSHCDKAAMHSDIYGTEDKSWNIVFPLITVEGTDPELDVLSEDMNTAIGVHYLKDVAYAMGDFGFHQTRPSKYYDPDDDSNDYGNNTANGVPIRVVFGAYCSQIDETNVAMIRHVYDGDDPAPFADQFKEFPMREVHWDTSGEPSLARPTGKGY